MDDRDRPCRHATVAAECAHLAPNSISEPSLMFSWKIADHARPGRFGVFVLPPLTGQIYRAGLARISRSLSSDSPDRDQQ